MSIQKHRTAEKSIETIKKDAHSAVRTARREYVFQLWKAQLLVVGGPLVGAVRGVIAKGETEGRPFDASSLAAYLGVPRTTVVRALQQLDEAGAMRKVREGRAVKLYLTNSGWRQYAAAWELMDLVIDDLLGNAHKLNER